MALRGVPVALSLGARKNGSADSRAFFIVIPAKILSTDAIVPPLIPPIDQRCGLFLILDVSAVGHQQAHNGTADRVVMTALQTVL